MQFGLFLGAEYPARRSMAARVNALVEQVRLARDLGFDCALAGQHYLSYPVQILQPTPLLGRLAGEAGDMRIGTGAAWGRSGHYSEHGWGVRRVGTVRILQLP